MAYELQKHKEPLEVEEMIFIVKKERKERKQYYKVFSFLMVLCFVIPFIGAWYRAFDGAPNAFSLPRFFVSAGVLLTISIAALWIMYRINVRKLQADIEEQTKTIECAHVVKKTYVPQNGTYFLYLDSTNKLSIEVKESDYHRLSMGDEVNIEFATHSRLYLGYF